MLKKAIPFIIAIPALFLLFIFKMIPAFYTLLLSFKDYNLFKGIFASTWAGTGNYRALFQSEAFGNIINNTLNLSFLSIILTTFLAFVLIICIYKMPDKWCKLCAIAILSIPAFIPVSSLAGVFMKVFSVDSGLINRLITSAGNEPILFFGNKAIYPLLFGMMDSLRNIFVPVIIGVLVCENKSKISFKSIAAVLAGYVAARFIVLMSPDIELLHITYNPIVYETADVFDTYSFRSGLMSMQFAPSSAAWVTKTLIQLLINIVAYFILSLLAPKISEGVKGISNRVNKSVDSIAAIIGYLLFALGSLAVIILIFVPSSGNIFQGMKLLMTNKLFINSVFVTFLYCFGGSIIYGFLTITLSYPLTVKTKIYPILLVIAISLTNNFMGEYMICKSMGAINTLLPVILSPALSAAGAFALYFTISGNLRDNIPGIGQYLKEAILPLVTIIALFFIANWGSYIYQLVFLSNTGMHGIGLWGMQLVRETGNMAVMSVTPDMIENMKVAFFFITSIIPALFGTVIIFLSKYLPLSAFASQLREN